MALGFIEVEYPLVSTAGGLFPVRGVQVGRFAVRQWLTDHPPSGTLLHAAEEDVPWRIDHIGTGAGMGAFATPEEAYAFADEISRQALRDPSAALRGDYSISSLIRTTERLKKQFGKILVEYIREVGFRTRYDEFIGYTEWREHKGLHRKKLRAPRWSIYD